MTTALVRAGGSVRAFSAQHLTTTSQIAAGTAVVLAYTTSTVGNNSSRGNNWLPPARVQLGTVSVPMPDGSTKTLPVMIDPQWYRFFDEVAQRRLGGVQGQSIPDVAQNANAAIESVSSVTQVASQIAQQADAVAAAATAVKEVLISSDLPGATQIPDVQRAGVLDQF